MGLGKDVFMRLLVLEDDTTVLEVLRRDLSALGYVLSSAPSVQAAQVALRAETFDFAVLSERLLLDADLSLTDHIRASAPNVRVILYSHHDGLGEREAVSEGDGHTLHSPKSVDWILRTPMSPLELTQVIDHLMEDVPLKENAGRGVAAYAGGYMPMGRTRMN